MDKNEQKPFSPYPTPEQPGEQNYFQPTPSNNQTPNISIVGFILSMVLSIVGLIVSIVALRRARKENRKDNLALWGVVIGSIFTVASLAISVPLGIRASEIVSRCRDSTTGIVFLKGKTYECPSFLVKSKSAIQASYPKASSDAESVSNTGVELKDGKVVSACFTFDLPTGYILSPNATSCQAEIRQTNGTSTGESLTSIKVLGQVGGSTIDDFFETMKDAGSDTSSHKRLTISGNTIGTAVAKDSSGFSKTMYFVIDGSGHFKSGENAITSYLIYGPSTIAEPLETIINSFTIN